MSEHYQIVNERRVRCGRCRHEMNQSRVEVGRFNTPTTLHYTCGDCHAQYPVCIACGWYIADADGVTCHMCELNPDGMPVVRPADERPPMLPKHIKEQSLEPDPSRRAGHWYHPATDEIISMPIGWKPGVGLVDAPAAPDDADPDGRVGKPVMLLLGRYEGTKGVITEVGLNEDGEGLRVHHSDSGKELPFESFEPYLRFMTAEEIVAAAEALKAEKAGKKSAAAAGDTPAPDVAELLKKSQADLKEMAGARGLTFTLTSSKLSLATAIVAADEALKAARVDPKAAAIELARVAADIKQGEQEFDE